MVRSQAIVSDTRGCDRPSAKRGSRSSATSEIPVLRPEGGRTPDSGSRLTATGDFGLAPSDLNGPVSHEASHYFCR